MPPVWPDLSMAAFIIIVTLLLGRLSRFLIDEVGHRLISRTASHVDDVVLNAISFPLRNIILVAGLHLALFQIGIVAERWGDILGRLFFLTYLVLVYLLVYRLIGGLIEWYGQTVVQRADPRADNQFLAFFRHVAYTIVTIAAVIVLLSELNVEVSALITTLGIGSLAIALAAQATLGDIISGFMIVIDQPFKVGDRVEIQDIDTWGDVTEIGLRSTRIRTRDNRMVAVPNSVIGKGLVVNYSVPDRIYRVQTHVGVAYGTDVEHARQVMIETIRAERWVMKELPVEALFLEFADSALVFRVRCWIENYVETRRIIDKMNTALYKALEREDITIPFPQRDLHLRSGFGRATLEPADASLHDNEQRGV